MGSRCGTCRTCNPATRSWSRPGATTFTYVIDTDPEDLVVGFDDTWVVSERPVNPDHGGVGPAEDRRLLTLTTCAELFHTDDRMVVFGHLVSSSPRS